MSKDVAANYFINAPLILSSKLCSSHLMCSVCIFKEMNIPQFTTLQLGFITKDQRYSYSIEGYIFQKKEKIKYVGSRSMSQLFIVEPLKFPFHASILKPNWYLKKDKCSISITFPFFYLNIFDSYDMRMDILSIGILSLLLLDAFATAAAIQQHSLQQDKSIQNFERMKRSFASRKDSMRLMHQRRSASSSNTAAPSINEQDLSRPNIYYPPIIQNYAYSTNPGYANYYPIPAANGGYYISSSNTGYYPANPSNTISNVYYPIASAADMNPYNLDPSNPTNIEYQPIPSPEPIPVPPPQVTQLEPLPVIPISENVSRPPPPLESSSKLSDEKDEKNKTTKTKDTKKKDKDDDDEEDEDEPDEEDFDAEDLVE